MMITLGRNIDLNEQKHWVYIYSSMYTYMPLVVGNPCKNAKCALLVATQESFIRNCNPRLVGGLHGHYKFGKTCSVNKEVI